MLSQKAIEEFKEIWKAEYGQDLSEQEAMEKAERFILLFKAIYRPIQLNKEYEQNKKKSKRIP